MLFAISLFSLQIRRLLELSAIRNAGQVDPQPCSSTTVEPEADYFADEEAPDVNAEQSMAVTPISITSSNVTAAAASAEPITPISITNVTAAATPAKPECSRCDELKNSLKKYQKENPRLRIVNAKLRAEIKVSAVCLSMRNFNV